MKPNRANTIRKPTGSMIRRIIDIPITIKVSVVKTINDKKNTFISWGISPIMF